MQFTKDVISFKYEGIPIVGCLQTSALTRLTDEGAIIWRESNRPKWWGAYTSVNKHNRDVFFHISNLRNVLFAFSGLLSTLIMYYRLIDVSTLIPAPKYFKASLFAAPAGLGGDIHGIRVDTHSIDSHLELLDFFSELPQKSGHHDPLAPNKGMELQRVLDYDSGLIPLWEYFGNETQANNQP